MNLTFYGAAHEVTGSCYLLETSGKKVLIDCGLQQGMDALDDAEFQLPFKAASIDYVLLTHAHIDHSGRLPLLYKHGFSGKVFCTGATERLCNIMLRDSAHIQETEMEWRNRRSRRSGGYDLEPLYSMKDAEGILKQFQRYDYYIEFDVADGIKARFVDAGHLLGSSSIEVWITENGVSKKLAFSGDIGNFDQPLINDPTYIDEADYVIIESTYADRLHEPNIDVENRLANIIQSTLDKGGNVIIPSFAVGRTQEMLYLIRHIKNKEMVTGHDDFRVVVDSPLAIEATNIFNEISSKYYDAEARALLAQGVNPIGFEGLEVSLTSDDSMNINEDKEPKVIISASGMCDAGRIRHHLKHNLWRKDSTILFVGYQAVGTLGNIIEGGAKKVKIFGEEIAVRARIEKLNSTSSHADRSGLMRWLDSFKKPPLRVFAVHGQSEVTEKWADDIRKQFNYNAVAPYLEEVYDLAENLRIKEGVKPKKRVPSKNVSTNMFYKRLMDCGKYLVSLISGYEGRANADIKKLTRDLEALCRKYEDKE